MACVVPYLLRSFQFTCSYRSGKSALARLKFVRLKFIC